MLLGIDEDQVRRPHRGGVHLLQEPTDRRPPDPPVPGRVRKGDQVIQDQGNPGPQPARQVNVQMPEIPDDDGVRILDPLGPPSQRNPGRPEPGQKARRPPRLPH